MRTFHCIEQRRAKLGPPAKTEERLPLGQSVAFIFGLAVLSWLAVIWIAVALRSAF